MSSVLVLISYELEECGMAVGARFIFVNISVLT